MRAAALALLLLGGCSQLPDYARPAPPPTGPYPGAVGGTRRPATEIGWRDFFRDPRLQALIARALEHNADLRTAVLRIDEARAQYRIARADLLPALDLRASARFGNAQGGGGRAAPVPGVDPITGVDPIVDPGGGVGGAGGGGGGGRYRLELAVTNYELDFWGRVRSLSAAARARYLNTVEAQRAFQIGLIGDVAEAYLTERELTARIDVATATRATRAHGLALAERLAAGGEASRVEIAQERALLAQAESELAALQRSRAQALNQLQFLVGRPLDALPPPAPLLAQAIVTDLPAGLPSDLLSNRPDILAAEQLLIAANADIGVARAAFFPRIALTATAGLASNQLGDLFDPGSFAWSFVPNLLQPLFNAGRNRASLALSEVRKEIAVVAYERAVQTAFREVADALAARALLAEETRARAVERAAQAERVRLADLRFRAGEAPAVETLDAQRALFAAEQALLQARRAEFSNAVLLYAALGGGLVL